MALNSPYKPSPLSFGSPRSSPFRRPESPASPSTVKAAITPGSSPTKPHTPVQTSLRNETASWTPRGLDSAGSGPTTPTHSPTRMAARGVAPPTARPTSASFGDPSEALNKLSADQVRELREAFQLLDRNNDGLIERDDVAYLLNNLGQESNASIAATFFPAGAPQRLTLPQYLTQMSTLLAPISPAEELISAFGAFDEDDDGKIDLAELRGALLHTAPDLQHGGRALSEGEVDRVLGAFAARRAFGKAGGGRGDVFKYHDFVAAVSGKGENENGARDK